MPDDPELREQMLRTARKAEEEIDYQWRRRRAGFWIVAIGVLLFLGILWWTATHQYVQ